MSYIYKVIGSHFSYIIFWGKIYYVQYGKSFSKIKNQQNLLDFPLY